MQRAKVSLISPKVEKQQTNEEHKPKTKLRCNYCKKKGHLMRDCYSLKRKNQEKEKDSKGKQPEASIVEDSYLYSDALPLQKIKPTQSIPRTA